MFRIHSLPVGKSSASLIVIET